MEIQRLLTNLSSRIIIHFAVVVVAAVVLIALNFDVIYPFYFENQLTDIGILINSAILLLLIVGLGNILYNLLRYKREEETIARFVANVEAQKPDLTEGLPADCVVSQRQVTLRSIQKANGEINHGALAAMLNADEATRFGLIRFINNILILTGVFGTIVALSIALLGASDLIDSSDASLGGMGLVVHGMSTALSTTITAIVSFLIFGYFYTRLADVQTHFLSGVEHLTSVYMLPHYVSSEEQIVQRMSELVKSIIHAADKLKTTQDTYQESALGLQQSITANQQQIEALSSELQTIASSQQRIEALGSELQSIADSQQQIEALSSQLLAVANSQQQIDTLGAELQDIKHLLREGFRLPADSG